MRQIALAAVALMLVGCGPASPSPSAPIATAAPDLERPFSDGDGRAWRLLAYDPASLLSDVQQVSAAEHGPANIAWDPVVGSPNSLVLVWMGGVCTTDRVLTVSDQVSHVSLTVFEGHNRPLAPGEVCPAVGMVYGLRLTFREAISGFDFKLSFAELPQ